MIRGIDGLQRDSLYIAQTRQLHSHEHLKGEAETQQQMKDIT